MERDVSVFEVFLFVNFVLLCRHFVFQDVFPMIRELDFDPKFRQAMLTVFGKTLMCRDIDVASQYSKSANLDCVTMEGRE